MKLLPFVLLLLSILNSFSQEKKFNLEGRIVDENNKPVSDVYIVNFKNLEKNISAQNGVFNIWVYPEDSLLISHISFYKKIITVHELLFNPIVQIQRDTINILDINVSPNQKNDYERARENIDFLQDLDIPSFTKIETETDPVNQMMIEQNKVLRSEATSIMILRFSPTEYIGKVVSKIKKRKTANQYSNSKKNKKNKKKLSEKSG